MCEKQEHAIVSIRDILEDTVQHKVENITFIANSIFKKNTDETISSILLKLMKREIENM